MLILKKRAKVIIAVAAFAAIAAAGFLIEKLEKDAFVTETVARDDAVSYSSDAPSLSDGKININSAGVTELSVLSGIGEALSKRIIDYRDANGAFETTEEIMNVPGINQNKYEAIKDFICAQ